MLLMCLSLFFICFEFNFAFNLSYLETLGTLMMAFGGYGVFYGIFC